VRGAGADPCVRPLAQLQNIQGMKKNRDYSYRITNPMRNILSAITFQICWFICVLGPVHGRVWVGPIVVSLSWLIHLITRHRRNPMVWITMVCVLAGFIVDTAFIRFGTYMPVQMGPGAMFSPIWLTFMWINLALLMNESMRWLQGKYRLSAILGALGGASSYAAGGSLGGIVIQKPYILQLIVIGAAWAVILPFLVWCVHTINRR